MIINMMIGLLTPPVGLALFIVSNIAKTAIAAVAREVVPYVLAFVMILHLITYVPQFSLWLPDLAYGASRS